MKKLRCPSCGREVIVAKVERVLSAQSTMCPYPECAAVVVTVMKWTDEAPTVLYTHTDVASVFRKKLLTALPSFFIAQTILAFAVYGAGYAIQHVREAPPPSNIGQSLTQIGIGLGACGLLLPSLLSMLALVFGLVRRFRNDRAMLRRLDSKRDSFRLVPRPRTYRAA